MFVNGVRVACCEARLLMDSVTAFFSAVTCELGLDDAENCLDLQAVHRTIQPPIVALEAGNNSLLVEY